MSLVRYEPWSLLNQLHSEIDQLFDPRNRKLSSETSPVSTADWVPAVDIKEEPERFVIHADVPGVDPDAIEVSMENGVLTISGKREEEKKEEREGYKRIERVRGSFFRRFTLPDTADAEHISAKARNGVLEIVIPKHEKVQPRRIQVEG
ncbi:Hsp20/alpha crystallin family protein [Thiohalobacter sp. IOR34]|uniref:Hsp20/alpha crystallin family protein n=1 Tax=Thiohalobacter sp. IOR34 TaxID=3057176 RepID=UPI0025B1AEAD|nr:Hsp20/alpha crystallin family protein [Thiohalobacter sp. IOR34]WJW75821.1 Hsp20/alpha crystallin family protein [Thiohalobacter sp. IOR34]